MSDNVIQFPCKDAHPSSPEFEDCADVRSEAEAEAPEPNTTVNIYVTRKPAFPWFPVACFVFAVTYVTLSWALG
ncbi:hypothetical protein [Ruegeria arenilitoris]|uniref:hypothetical protein n=1 Tax=Ruegeria arenilitoris TaxID=1173585 RepID=UPI00147B9121|nr:hypothetical protein [Ruegeria arenilitoris]